MKRILAVDDEPHVTRMVQHRLRREGYDVVTAQNGIEALEKMAEEGPFDAVITDYNMPKMDGRELCTALRERYADVDLHIFLVTARVEEALRDWATGLPSVEYIEKPLSLHDMVDRLAKRFAPNEPTGSSDGGDDA